MALSQTQMWEGPTGTSLGHGPFLLATDGTLPEAKNKNIMRAANIVTIHTQGYQPCMWDEDGRGL